MNLLPTPAHVTRLLEGPKMANATHAINKKLVWITGASSGIGAQTALAMAAEGYQVIATARNGEKLAELVSHTKSLGNIIALPCDVTERECVNELIDKIINKYGVPQYTLLNAGNFKRPNYQPLKHRPFDVTMDCNYTGTINCLVPLLNVMPLYQNGAIGIVASVAGYGGLPGGAAYGPTKAALINLAESMYFDMKPAGINIKIINPGYVDTPLTADNRAPMPFLMPVDKAAKRIAKEIKNKRFESTFPRRFTWFLKLVNKLPYGLYFTAIRTMTGYKGKIQ